MIRIRVEAVEDKKTGRYFLEIYEPEDASAPIVTSVPIYKTAAAAETDVLASLAVFASRGGAGR